MHSVVLGMKYAVPSMVARGGGSIVNTASIAGLQAGYGPFAYSVAKGAVVHLSRVAAAALAKDAIRVNAICPGLIPTSIFGRALGESIADADRRARDISERAHGLQPIRIAGSPEDIGYAVAYFASDLSRFVTGQFLAVDGGITVGPRSAWEESAAIESWTRIGMSEEQVKKLLGTATILESAPHDDYRGGLRCPVRPRAGPGEVNDDGDFSIRCSRTCCGSRVDHSRRSPAPSRQAAVG